MLSQEIIESIKVEAIKQYPKEACGIIVDNKFIPIENSNEKPEKNFTISAEKIARFLGKIQFIVHTHCRKPAEAEIFDLRTPSFSDILGQKQTNIPWLIFGTEGLTLSEPLQIPRIKNNKYLLRPFIWYINDCYSLVQDYYEFEFGIHLDNHRAKEDYKDIRKLNDIFAPYIEEYGFIKFNPIRHEYKNGDLVLLNSGGFEKNHLGIFENGYILHQDLVSKKERIEHFIDYIHLVLRHESKNI